MKKILISIIAVLFCTMSFAQSNIRKVYSYDDYVQYKTTVYNRLSLIAYTNGTIFLDISRNSSVNNTYGTGFTLGTDSVSAIASLTAMLDTIDSNPSSEDLFSFFDSYTAKVCKSGFRSYVEFWFSGKSSWGAWRIYASDLRRLRYRYAKYVSNK